MLVAPNVDGLMLVDRFALNYFVDAMNCCLKTVDQMKAFHLKNVLMLIHRIWMEDVTPWKAGVLIPFPLLHSEWLYICNYK